MAWGIQNQQVVLGAAIVRWLAPLVIPNLLTHAWETIFVVSNQMEMLVTISWFKI